MIPAAVSGTVNQAATVMMNLGGTELMIITALFLAFRHLLGCEAGTDSFGGLALYGAWFVHWLQRAYDKIIKAGTDAALRTLQGFKHLLQSVGLGFLTPLVDAAIAALKSSADALMSPLVKAALFAVLGAWLILRLLKR